MAEVGDLQERVGRLEAERDAARAQTVEAEAKAQGLRDRAAALEAERDAARAEVAEWTAGGPLARAWRAFTSRRMGRP